MRSVPTAVCLVEDHQIVREGVEMLLDRSGFEVVGSVGTAAEALRAVERRVPAVAVIDVNLPDEPGPALTRRLLARHPDVRVLLYTGAADPDEISGAMRCGAHGIVSKASDPAEFRRAIKIVRDGGTFVDPALAAALSGGRPQQRVLTAREAEVLDLLAVGLNGEEVAQRLVLSSETVRTHVRNASARLGARTRAHAVVLALRLGEIGA